MSNAAGKKSSFPSHSLKSWLLFLHSVNELTAIPVGKLRLVVLLRYIKSCQVLDVFTDICYTDWYARDSADHQAHTVPEVTSHCHKPVRDLGTQTEHLCLAKFVHNLPFRYC